VKAPAKVNFTLKVGKKRPDGFHPVESVMCAVNLFDYLTLDVEFGDCISKSEIRISSDSNEIPHDASNLAWRAAELFLETVKRHAYINIYIEKNIPVCAGLAGGSTDASAVLYALNKVFLYPLSDEKIDELCAKLGSDLNFCLRGGTKMCLGRGEIIVEHDFIDRDITIVKPLNLKISAKEAYQRLDECFEAGRMSNMQNDLEFALLDCHAELKFLHGLGLQMSGSGPSFFACVPCLEKSLKDKLDGEYLVIEGLKTFNGGICEVK